MDIASPASKWRALVVEEVDHQNLYEGFINKYPTLADLPTAFITVYQRPERSLDSPFAWFWSRLDHFFDQGVAILSWRWDNTRNKGNPARASRNIFLAIDYAKKHKIKYLLIDIVSVDQKKKGDLLKQVIAFSQLYSTTPVLCAYNDRSNKTLYTMRRPWIHSEMCKMSSSTAGITVLVSDYFHYAPWVERSVDRIKGVDMDAYYRGPDYKGTQHVFASQLESLNHDGFLPTIFMLMLGEVKMHKISDIQYIFPVLAPVLSVAYKEMTNKDYLMTVALLSRVLAEDFANITGVAVDNMVNIYNLRFDRYSLRPRQAMGDDDYYFPDIYFDGIQIGHLMIGDGIYIKNSGLTLAKNAESLIFSGLGMPEQALQDYIREREEYLKDIRHRVSRQQLSNITIMTMGSARD